MQLRTQRIWTGDVRFDLPADQLSVLGNVVSAFNHRSSGLYAIAEASQHPRKQNLGAAISWLSRSQLYSGIFLAAFAKQQEKERDADEFGHAREGDANH